MCPKNIIKEMKRSNVVNVVQATADFFFFFFFAKNVKSKDLSSQQWFIDFSHAFVSVQILNSNLVGVS